MRGTNLQAIEGLGLLFFIARRLTSTQYNVPWYKTPPFWQMLGFLWFGANITLHRDYFLIDFKRYNPILFPNPS
jgi:hypothetical protein